MATSTSVPTSRFDGKLDALLRRELSQSEYERLVATEVCISVPRGSGKRTHGHVIIGPSHLYFAPIPVKKIRLLLALSDILSVAVIDDQPDFLSGKEQECTVHLSIEYKQNDQTTPTSSPNKKNLLTTSPTHSLKLTRPPAVSHDGEGQKKPEWLDLFLLQSETLFVSYLNFHLEDFQLGKRQYNTLILDKEGATQRYHSLKSDLYSAQTIQESAKLYLELSSALGLYFQLKLLYWQDNGELLLESLKDMKKWNESPLADVLEYKVIITEVILKVFQDTLVSKPKLSLLKRNNGQTLCELSECLLDAFVTDSLSDGKLMDELSVNCCAILYELSRVIQQVRLTAASSPPKHSQTVVLSIGHIKE
uniref:Uncharacterized protein n=1 Tax=Amphimedon queenslandica TaxID=400682 RepID=A0A1X7VB24_AMPQE